MSEEIRSRNLSLLKERAEKISKENGNAAQHIEELPHTIGVYRISDWYDADNTVTSYNGREWTHNLKHPKRHHR